MSDRDTLIARKHEVRRQIERLRREVERLRAQPSPEPLPKKVKAKIEKLERELEQLMATEYNLRTAIDRSNFS